MRLRTAFSVLFIAVLMAGLGLITVPRAQIHDFCDGATVTITATGEMTECHLTISATAGGSVDIILDEEQTTIGPGETETVSHIPAGTVGALAAQPEDGYWFINWTGDVDTIDDVDAAATTITMAGDYIITANFEEIPPRRANWPLIGGIIAAAVIVAGLLIFFVRRRKAAGTKGY